ncbi:hypothetical protein ACOMHN_023916 [Nucella lapillus]
MGGEGRRVMSVMMTAIRDAQRNPSPRRDALPPVASNFSLLLKAVEFVEGARGNPADDASNNGAAPPPALLAALPAVLPALPPVASNFSLLLKAVEFVEGARGNPADDASNNGAAPPPALLAALPAVLPGTSPGTPGEIGNEAKGDWKDVYHLLGRRIQNVHDCIVSNKPSEE